MTPPSCKEKEWRELLANSRLPINPAFKSEDEVKIMRSELGKREYGLENNDPSSDSDSTTSLPLPSNITINSSLTSTFPSFSSSSTEDPTINVPPDSLFEVRSTSNKGLAVFATSPILKGTLLLAEKVLLRVLRTHYQVKDVEEALAALGEEERNRYWALASCHGQNASLYPTRIHPSVPINEKTRIREQHVARTSSSKTALSIFMTNAMECGSGAAVFEIAARFNHSCIPNAFFSWNRKTEEERIYAIRDLEVGEEITLSYIDPFYDHSLRVWELQHYGFQCFCPACTSIDDPTSFGYQSRTRRFRLGELDEQMSFWTEEDRIKGKIETAKLMREEGLWVAGLGDVYLSLARLCAGKNDFRFAAVAAQRALDVYTTCLGSDSEKTVDAGKSLRAFSMQMQG